MPINKQPNRLMPFLMIVVGGALILAVGGWYLGSLLRAANNPRAEATPTEVNYPQVARVDPADAKAAYDSGSALFVDVRDAASYAQGHIPGALSIPLAELAERAGELNPGDWLIPY